MSRRLRAPERLKSYYYMYVLKYILCAACFQRYKSSMNHSSVWLLDIGVNGSKIRMLWKKISSYGYAKKL